MPAFCVYVLLESHWTSLKSFVTLSLALIFTPFKQFYFRPQTLRSCWTELVHQCFFQHSSTLLWQFDKDPSCYDKSKGCSLLMLNWAWKNSLQSAFSSLGHTAHINPVQFSSPLFFLFCSLIPFLFTFLSIPFLTCLCFTVLIFLVLCRLGPARLALLFEAVLIVPPLLRLSGIKEMQSSLSQSTQMLVFSCCIWLQTSITVLNVLQSLCFIIKSSKKQNVMLVSSQA